LRFWQHDVGLRFDHVLPVRRGQKQYRHDALGSVIKLNHHIEPLPAAAPSGYRELIIARASVGTPCAMVDPDGNRMRLAPTGHDGITQLAVTMGVRSISEHRRFYGGILASPNRPGPVERPFAWETACFFWRRTMPQPSPQFVRHSAGAISDTAWVEIVPG
jgi:hypothetical protein